MSGRLQAVDGRLTGGSETSWYRCRGARRRVLVLGPLTLVGARSSVSLRHACMTPYHRPYWGPTLWSVSSDIP